MPDSEPLAAARALFPLIRQHAAEGDANRCILPSVAQAMAEAGLFRIAVARSAGGFELPSTEQVRVIEEVSRADGGAGWTLMIAVETTGIASGAITPEAAAEVFGRNRNAIVAGALNPLGRGERVEGGYRLTGQWPFASACHHADYFWGQFIETENGEPVPGPGGRLLREALIPRDQFTILDTWNVGGLRGSGSADVRAEDVFIPAHMTTTTTQSGGASREDGTLFRMPLYSRLAYNKTGVAFGIARAAIDAFIDLASNKIPRGSARLLNEREMVQRAVAEAEAQLRSARAWVFEATDAMWETVARHEAVLREDRALLQLACSHAVEACERAVEIVYKAAGVSANFLDSPLERCMRDIHVIPGHIMVAPTWYEPAGRVLLGMESRSFML